MENFLYNPDIKIRRSKFNMDYTVKDAFLSGQLVPLGEPIEVLPGDTFKIDLNTFVRLNPSVNVPLDNAHFGVWWFFVPNRILWNRWKEFCGENTSSPWIPTTTYAIPQIKLITSSYTAVQLRLNSILCHMGVNDNPRWANPSSSSYPSVSRLPVLGYCSIWQEFFRDENQDYPLNLNPGSVSDVNYSPVATSNYADSLWGNRLLPLNRFHDYFSNALPSPVKAAASVRLPSYVDGVNTSTSFPFYSGTPSLPTYYRLGTDSSGAVHFYNTSGTAVTSSTAFAIRPDFMGTIEEFRVAYLTDFYLQKLGKSGSRYVEVIKNFFGVTAPDYLVDRPVLLGASDFLINMNPVVQTSASETTTLDGTSIDEIKGSVSGYSATFNKSFGFVHSFVEHGYIIGVYGVRTERTYSQCLSKMWTRKHYLDFYNPCFSSLGMQPIFKREIFSGYPGATVNPSDVWGYTEAWNEYRYRNNLVCGGMKDPSLLASWTYADTYSSSPTLSASWLEEGFSNLNRTLAVTGQDSQTASANAPYTDGFVPQFLVDFGVKCEAIRPIPVRSIPGLKGFF